MSWVEVCTWRKLAPNANWSLSTLFSNFLLEPHEQVAVEEAELEEVDVEEIVVVDTEHGDSLGSSAAHWRSACNEESHLNLALPRSYNSKLFLVNTSTGTWVYPSQSPPPPPPPPRQHHHRSTTTATTRSMGIPITTLFSVYPYRVTNLFRQSYVALQNICCNSFSEQQHIVKRALR
jgi:hypothetical protein